MQLTHPKRIPSARLDAIFAALADPTRRAILVRLTEGAASVTELAAPFRMSQPAISKHLKVLEKAGLISRRPGGDREDGRRTPSRIEGRSLQEIDSWLGDFKKFWAESFDRLDSVLEQMER